MSQKKKCFKPGSCASGGIVGGAQKIDEMKFGHVGVTPAHIGMGMKKTKLKQPGY